MRARLVLGVAVVLALGCASKKFAPVSGKVTMNGRPLAKAEVSFQPVAAEGSVEAGVGSNGMTNEQGQFTLKAATGQDGAVVGKHRVRISVMNPDTESDVRVRVRPGRMVNQVPARYNANTTLDFEVPAGGTDKADFPLTSP